MSIRSLVPASLMVSIFSIATFAQDKAAAQSTGAGFASILPMMILMFVIIYFLMIRPEQKKQKDKLNMLKNLKKGDKIITTGGILGTVGNVKENTIMVKIAENTVIEVSKSAISVLASETDKTAEKKESEKADKK